MVKNKSGKHDDISPVCQVTFTKLSLKIESSYNAKETKKQCRPRAVVLKRVYCILIWSLRPGTTVAHKCAPNSKSSHRIRKAHTKFERPTPNSKSLTPNSKTQTEFQNLTPNSKFIFEKLTQSVMPNSSPVHSYSFLPFKPFARSRSRVGREMRCRSLCLSACDCNWNFSMFCENCGNIHNPCTNYCSKCGSGKKIFLFMLF